MAEQHPAVVAWPADILFGARIRGAAEATGTLVRLVRDGEELVVAARESAPRLVVVDLDARGEPVAAIARLTADPATAGVPVLAYASHVREDVMAAARAAGAERVVARGQFARDLPALLKGGR